MGFYRSVTSVTATSKDLAGLLQAPDVPRLTSHHLRAAHGVTGRTDPGLWCLLVFLPFPLDFLPFPALSSSLNSFLMDQGEGAIRTLGVSQGMLEMERDHIPMGSW